MTIIRTPGIEPELLDWKSNSLPLTYVRTNIYYIFSLNSFIEKIFIKYYSILLFVPLLIFLEIPIEKRLLNCPYGFLSLTPC